MNADQGGCHRAIYINLMSFLNKPIYLYCKQLYMNWYVIIIVSLIIIGLLVFLVMRNRKDEKDFEQQLNQDYHHTKDAEGDVDEEEAVK
jgi:uncharacterized membrane protein